MTKTYLMPVHHLVLRVLRLVRLLKEDPSVRDAIDESLRRLALRKAWDRADQQP
jgi:hypothetical protein